MKFHANSFEEIVELSKKHASEMFLKGDAPHLKAMQDMKTMMRSANALQEWFQIKRNEFNALPEQ